MSLPVIVVHGGAGNISSQLLAEKLEMLRPAVDAGFAQLASGSPTAALEAVEAAVRVMESHPAFNAGYGSSLTIEGEVEMDALIMEGTQRKAGAVGAVRRVANPVTLARQIMERTDHVFLVGQRADDFAVEVGMPLVDNASLVTSKGLKRLQEHKAFLEAVNSSKDHDTVGAVAVDSSGRVACATSTGGLTGKRAGRVGDSPIIGAGGLADDALGAVSTTGHGEAIMRSCLAQHIAMLMQHGQSPQQALWEALESMREKTQGGCGGAIVVTPKGDVAAATTTQMMPWAYRNAQAYHAGTACVEDKPKKF